MAFNLKRWSRIAAASNVGRVSVSGVLQNGPNMFSYATGDDAAATVEAANYFAAVVFELAIDDIIFAQCSDAFTARIVSAIDREAGTVSTTSIGLNDSIATANIDNLAVTNAKLGTDAVTQAKVADNAIGTAELIDANVTSAKLDEQLVQHARVSLTLAELVGTYTTSHLLVAAPAAGKKLILHRAVLAVDYGGTVLADGGAVHVQYDSTANGAGTKASNTLAAATLIAATADTTFGFTPVDTTLTDSTTLAKGLYLATATADFTGGTGSTYEVDIWYSTVDLT
jgi:hypothetical protein